MEYTPGYKSLLVYQKAHELVLSVYRLTRGYPKDEQFGLISQMRRAAVSVPANLIEGWGRATPNDKRHFYVIARASLGELHYYLELSIDLFPEKLEEIHLTIEISSQVGKLLRGFVKQ